MQLPVKAHYATLAMLALAEKFQSREPMPVRLIAREQQIPSQFLGQILQQLRSAGLVTSTRGACGGFVLDKPPGCISMADVIDVICPVSSGTAPPAETSPLSQAVNEVWERLRLSQREILSALTLEDLLRNSADSTPMFYI